MGVNLKNLLFFFIIFFFYLEENFFFFLQTSTQPEYVKWIKPGLQARENTLADVEESPRQPKTMQSFDDDLILILSRKKPSTEKPKYVFLSEKDATVKGEFSEKFKDERENKDIPRPYQGDRPKAYSSMGMMSATPDRKSGRTIEQNFICTCTFFRAYVICYFETFYGYLSDLCTNH